MPHRSTSSGMPARLVTASTTRNVSVPCSAPSGAISFSTPVDVSACTTATSRARGCAPLRVEEKLGVEGTAPRLVDPDDVSAAPAGDLAHALPEDAVDPDDRGVARLEEVDEAGLHPGGAGAADREVRRFSVPNTTRRRSMVSSRRARNSGSRWPSIGRVNALRRLGIRVRGPGAEEQPVGERHRDRIVRVARAGPAERDAGPDRSDRAGDLAPVLEEHGDDRAGGRSRRRGRGRPLRRRGPRGGDLRVGEGDAGPAGGILHGVGRVGTRRVRRRRVQC